MESIKNAFLNLERNLVQFLFSNLLKFTEMVPLQIPYLAEITVKKDTVDLVDTRNIPKLDLEPESLQPKFSSLIDKIPLPYPDIQCLEYYSNDLGATIWGKGKEIHGQIHIARPVAEHSNLWALTTTYPKAIGLFF